MILRRSGKHHEDIENDKTEIETRINVQSTIFSFTLIDKVLHELKDVHEKSGISKNPEFYGKLKTSWKKNLIELGQHAFPAENKLDSADPRVNTLLPPLKRLKGLPGFPPLKVDFPNSQTVPFISKDIFVPKEDTRKIVNPLDEEFLPRAAQNKLAKAKISNVPESSKEDVVHGSLVNFNSMIYAHSIHPELSCCDDIVLEQARVVQIVKRKNALNRIIETILTIRFKNGKEIECPWPSSFLSVANKIDASDLVQLQSDPLSCPSSTNVNSGISSNQELLKEVNHLLDGFLMDEDEDEDNGFLFNYTSLLDEPSQKVEGTETEQKDIGEAQSLAEENQMYLLLTGEKITKSNLDEVETYFEQIGKHKKKINWKIATNAGIMEVFFSFHSFPFHNF
jgi:hypothetical protein